MKNKSHTPAEIKRLSEVGDKGELEVKTSIEKCFCQAYSEVFCENLKSIDKLSCVEFGRGNISELIELCEMHHKIRMEESK
jgi:hypothetical protein